MIPQWQPGIVHKIEHVTPNNRRYWIQLPETPVFDFKPGQFVTLDLPISEQRNKRWRSYSIASAPAGNNIIELIITHVEGGAGTDFIFNVLHEGSTVQLRGPQGVFQLPAVLDKDLFLICTGTGIAPFRSMVDHIYNQKIEHKNIYLIFGTRTKADLLYYNEMKDLENRMPGFHYLPTLSRETWEGATGYVHALYERLCVDHQPATFMLCGWKEMIQEAEKRIEQSGYDKKNIITELYG